MSPTIEIHHASDRRCYNGCPSTDLQREIDSKANAKTYLRKRGISVTWFPNGEFYVGFDVSTDGAPQIITPDCKSLQECCNLCLEYLPST